MTPKALRLKAFLISCSMFGIVLVIMALLTACGEKPCKHEGDRKYSNGHVYVCKDSGMGLTWVEK